MRTATKITAAAAAIYAMTSAGLLAIWADESGIGFQIYAIGGLFLEGGAL
jgi:hypothetical protein